MKMELSQEGAALVLVAGAPPAPIVATEDWHHNVRFVALHPTTIEWQAGVIRHPGAGNFLIPKGTTGNIGCDNMPTYIYLDRDASCLRTTRDLCEASGAGKVLIAVTHAMSRASTYTMVLVPFMLYVPFGQE